MLQLDPLSWLGVEVGAGLDHEFSASETSFDLMGGVRAHATTSFKSSYDLILAAHAGVGFDTRDGVYGSSSFFVFSTDVKVGHFDEILRGYAALSATVEHLSGKRGGIQVGALTPLNDPGFVIDPEGALDADGSTDPDQKIGDSVFVSVFVGLSF